jgi:hypothetical protein
MITKTLIAAAAFATAIAATPVSVAQAGASISFGIHTDDGYFSFGNGPGWDGGWGGGGPGWYSCQDARQMLKWDYNHVQKLECVGKIYTFKVKNFGAWKTAKFNRNTGNYWIV